MRTIPYSSIVEKIDSVIAQLIDDTEGERDICMDLDVITDSELESIADYLELLEEIRGGINE